ncbi:MAG: DUF4142 domain-containing protein [Cyclobacteriaceae bacterium]|nr:DUF4142 domain-containing protein [Cyclobacteriaceae bacterium]
MKRTYFRILLTGSFCILLGCGSGSNTEKKENNKSKSSDTGKQGKIDSIKKSEKKTIQYQSLSKDESDFILKAADARMMGILEGKAAVRKGSTQEIKDYGALMIKDQTSMLNNLKRLTQQLSFPLPDTISEDKQDGLKYLLALESRKFDRKFIKMMKIDHRRDIRQFNRAKDYKNADVRNFASQYLPLIETHLDKVKSIRIRRKAAKPT